ncbi:cellulose binding domain-containing protein [Actinoallomurus spadix]|uniref:SGNH/GDSL hydrolase family protein n=1 Tax=Actinoallomurus spadix TaxID=79912 RepID=A0ABN0VXJ4_9ACTN|nr:cellulose binding domain-containing protein [Actinoallomurus spadix]MCO5985963.1 cellulose binding domain-containing protein [Actinoallomurus spadix]
MPPRQFPLPGTPLRWAVALAAVLLAAGALIGVGTARAESNGGVRVMPLGDSITDGVTIPGAYRTGLWQRFTGGGYRVDFVGSLSNGPSALGDHDHEGHSGWRIDQIDANIVGWLRAYTPHTVLLHIGTNDVIQTHDLSGAPARLSALIDHITATVPTAEVFVATIIPLASSGLEANARTYNSAIPGIVQSKANAGRHVHLVDLHAALTTADLLSDGVHPNATGFDKMAAAWFAALRSVPGSIGDTGGGGPTPTPPPGDRTCTAAYTLTGQWSGGFQASVTVTAGSTAITGWTVTWRYAGGQTVTQAWNATVTSSGSAVTARNAGYNGALAAGASAEFGFLGTSTGVNEVPTLTCTAT